MGKGAEYGAAALGVGKNVLGKASNFFTWTKPISEAEKLRLKEKARFDEEKIQRTLKELDEEKNELDEQQNVSNIQIKFLRTVSEKILSNKKTSIKARRTSKRLSEQIKRSSKRLSKKVRKNIKITVKDIYTNSYDKHLDFEMNRIDIFNNVKHLD